MLSHIYITVRLGPHIVGFDLDDNLVMKFDPKSHEKRPKKSKDHVRD